MASSRSRGCSWRGEGEEDETPLRNRTVGLSEPAGPKKASRLEQGLWLLANYFSDARLAQELFDTK